MTLKGLKRKLICFVLVICLATGDWLPVLASEITEAMATEQAQEVSEESVEEAAEISEEEEIPEEEAEEIAEEIVEEAPAEEPAVEVPEETPEEIPTEEPAVEVPEETPEEIPTEEPTEGNESLETPEEGDAEELPAELTEDELAAVSAFIEQLTSLDDENQIEETLKKYAEEADWDGYESYILACVNCYADICTSYDTLNENQKVKLEDVSKLENLEWLANLDEEAVEAVMSAIEQIASMESGEQIEETLRKYAEQEDLDGYKEYLFDSAEAVRLVKEYVESLNDTQIALVANAEKLATLEWLLNEEALEETIEALETELEEKSAKKTRVVDLSYVYANAAYSSVTNLRNTNSPVSVEPLEITKTAVRDTVNNDDTYDITLTAKAPSVPYSLLSVLDVSGSMKTNLKGGVPTGVDGDISRMDYAGNILKNIQNSFRENDNGSEMALVGFYSWAGNKPVSKNILAGISGQPYHGYEYPVYLDFKTWRNENIDEIHRSISLGSRPGSNEKSIVDLYTVNGDLIADGKYPTGIYSHVYGTIPNTASLLKKVPLIGGNGEIVRPIPQSVIDNPWSDTGNTYDPFYQTNWEMGLRVALDMLNDPGQVKADNQPVVLFLTDGVPQTFEYADRMASGSDYRQWMSAFTANTPKSEAVANLKSKFPNLEHVEEVYNILMLEKQGVGIGETEAFSRICALQAKDEAEAIRALGVQILAVMIGNGEVSRYNNMGYVVEGKRLTLSKNSTKSSDVLVYNNGEHLLLDGSNEKILEYIQGLMTHNYTDVVIEDNLSKYAEFVSTDTSKVTVTAMDKAGKTITLKRGSDYSIQFETVDENKNGDGRTEIVKLVFDSNYALKPGATYSMKFEVKPTIEAYRYYAKNGSYPNTADPDTGTHSGLKGFYSNLNDMTDGNGGTVEYIVGKSDNNSIMGTEGLEMSQQYDKPVIQVSFLEVPVTKSWVTTETRNSLPAVDVGLYINNTEYWDKISLSKTNNWSNKFTKVPKGFTYSVKEVTVLDNYNWECSPSSYTKNQTSTMIKDGFKITNTQIFKIPIEKTWEFYDINDLPRSMTVTLGRYGVSDIATTTLYNNNTKKWRGEFAIEYNPEHLTTATYYITETVNLGVLEYQTVYDIEKTDGTTIKSEVLTLGSRYFGTTLANGIADVKKISITNTELIDIPITKTWRLANPGLIENGQLISADGLVVAIAGGLAKTDDYVTTTLKKPSSGSTTWEGILENVPYKPGKQYYIKEYFDVSVAERNGIKSVYSVYYNDNSDHDTVTGAASSNINNRDYRYFTISAKDFGTVREILFTNTQTIDIPIEKIWNYTDINSIPNKITFSLGDRYGQTISTLVLLKSDFNSFVWSGKFVDVPYDPYTSYYITEYIEGEYEGGSYTSSYTVDVATGIDTTGNGSAYISAIDVLNINKIIFTNTELISIPVEKVWKTKEEYKIPTSIEVQLSEPSIGERTISLTKANGWKGNFDRIEYVPNSTYTIKEIFNYSGNVYSEAVLTTNSNETQVFENTTSISVPSEDIAKTQSIAFKNYADFEIPVRKVWVGGAEPDIRIGQTCNFSWYPSKWISANESWETTFNVSYLPGETYTYTEFAFNENLYKTEIRAGTETFTGTSTKAFTYDELFEIDEIVFTNTRINHLIIKKVVEGKYASRLDKYDFTINLNTTNASSLKRSYSAKAYKDNMFGTVVGEYEITPNTVEAFQLGHNEYLVIDDVPVEATFQIRETTPDNYTLSAVIEGRGSTMDEGMLENNFFGMNSYNDTTVIVTNTVKDVGPPMTSIITYNTSNMMMIAVSSIGLAFWGSAKKRSRKDRRHL